MVKKIDDYERMVILRDGTNIPIDDIQEISEYGEQLRRAKAGRGEACFVLSSSEDDTDIVTPVRKIINSGCHQSRAVIFQRESSGSRQFSILTTEVVNALYFVRASALTTIPETWYSGLIQSVNTRFLTSRME